MAEFSVDAQRFDPYKNFKPRMLVRIASLKPAEFVIIKLQQIAGQITA
jgi:hypothetical protein